MCLPNLENLTFSLYQFFAKLPKPHLDWVVFTIVCSKYNQFLTLGSFYKNPQIAIPNFAKEHPKRQAHIRIMLTCQCEIKSPDLSRRFPIPRVTNTIHRLCDPMCQIRKASFLCGTLGHKQSRQWNYWTYPNFFVRYLKRSILSFTTGITFCIAFQAL